MATLNGASVDTVEVYMPEYGVWTARIATTTNDEFPSGIASTLQIEDLTLSCTIRSGGLYVSNCHYMVVGGGGNWGRQIPALGDRSQGGIKLSALAKSVMEAANLAGVAAGSEGVESISIPTDRFLGQSWSRQSGTASSALDALTNRQWYVGTNGITTLAARTNATVTSLYIVERYDPIFGDLVLSVPESASIAQFAPGCVISQGVPSPVTAKEVTITSTPKGLTVGIRS